MKTSTYEVFLVPSQFSSIREAIGAIVCPTTIMISPGVYAEDLSLNGLPNVVISTTQFQRRGVVLTGAGVADSIIKIENTCLYLTGVELCSNGRARAIATRNSTVALQECVLAGNRVVGAKPSGAAMHCLQSSVRVQKSMIAGNQIEGAETGSGGGLY